jgi:hypothetical protein
MEVVQRVGDPDEDRGLRRLPKTRVLVEPPWDDVHRHIGVGDENVLSISHPLHFVLHPGVEVSRIRPPPASVFVNRLMVASLRPKY